VVAFWKKGGDRMLGARIALLRRDRAMSQRELSKALGISASAVGMYEQGRRQPPAELLVKIAELFCVSTDFLLTGESAHTDAPMLRRLLADFRRDTNLERADAALILSTILSEELTQGEKSAILDKKGGGQMDERFMREALRLAQEAADEGEVPVGCVVVDGERIVGRGRNRRETKKNALCHAELEAIDEACRTLGGWRLWRCELYVTLEPCPMCAGAIINSRIAHVYYGAKDEKAGSCGTLTDLFAMGYNHKPCVTGGILEDEAKALLQDFFRNLRANPKPKWRKPSP